MTIELFEKTICELLTNHADPEDDGLFDYDDLLEMWVGRDGCLSARFDNESIPCEAETWDVALDKIVDFVRAKCGGTK